MRELRVRVKLSDAKTMYKDVSHALTLNTECLYFIFISLGSWLVLAISLLASIYSGHLNIKNYS